MRQRSVPEPAVISALALGLLYLIALNRLRDSLRPTGPDRKYYPQGREIEVSTTSSRQELPMTTKAITPLRQRMIEDMRLMKKGISELRLQTKLEAHL